MSFEKILRKKKTKKKQHTIALTRCIFTHPFYNVTDSVMLSQDNNCGNSMEMLSHYDPISVIMFLLLYYFAYIVCRCIQFAWKWIVLYINVALGYMLWLSQKGSIWMITVFLVVVTLISKNMNHSQIYVRAFYVFYDAKPSKLSKII